MLFDCLKCENLKLRHSCIWLACLIIPVIPATMGTFNLLQNQGVLDKDWYSLWTQISLFYSMFFYGPLIALYCAYLWRLEHLNHNWNLLKSSPVHLSHIYLSKLIVIMKVTVFTQLWLAVLFIAGGKLAQIPGFAPVEIFLWLLRGTLAGLAVGSLQLLLSLFFHSFALPIGIALLGSVLGMFPSNKGLGMLWPYSLMLTGMNSNKSQDALAGKSLSYFLCLFLFFLVFSGISILVMKRRE